MIDTSYPSTGLTNPSAAQGAAQASANGLNTDYQSFLKLLVAQVQNQDPMAPMDSTTFVSQLAQLSQVEQAIMTNTNLEKVVDRLDVSQAFSDVALIGRDVRVSSDRVALEDGTASFEYSLDDTASNVSISIMAEDGTVVRTLPQPVTTPGAPVTVLWDGFDGSGRQLADGTYSVRITASNTEGEAVASHMTTTASVRQITYVNGTPMLVLGNGQEIPSSTILGVL